MTSITLDKRVQDASLVSSLTPQIQAVDSTAWRAQLAAMIKSGELQVGANGTTSAIQAIGGSVADPATAVAAQALGQDQAVADDFLSFIHLNPAERVRAQILNSIGLTEEQLAALPDEQRRKVEDLIRQVVEEEIRKDTEDKVAVSNENADVMASEALDVSAVKASDQKNTVEAMASTTTAATLEQLFPFIRPESVTRVRDDKIKLAEQAQEREERDA